MKAEYEKIIKEKDLAMHNEKLKFQSIKTKVIKYDEKREEYVNQLENRQIGRKQKLSDEQKKFILQQKAKGLSYRQIASKLNDELNVRVTHGTVANIVKKCV